MWRLSYGTNEQSVQYPHMCTEYHLLTKIGYDVLVMYSFAACDFWLPRPSQADLAGQWVEDASFASSLHPEVRTVIMQTNRRHKANRTALIRVRGVVKSLLWLRR